MPSKEAMKDYLLTHGFKPSVGQDAREGNPQWYESNKPPRDAQGCLLSNPQWYSLADAYAKANSSRKGSG